jgi:hypothetical protein
MAEEELTFPFKGSTHFHSLEQSGVKLQIDPQSVRAEYLRHVGEFVSSIKVACSQIKAEYIPISTRTPFHEALADFMSRRRKGR